MALQLMLNMPIRRRRANRVDGQRGFTLLEIVVASLIGVVVAGGTMTAVLLATRQTSSALHRVDMAGLFQQGFEEVRNGVYCGSAYFDATCAPQPASESVDLTDHPILKLDPSATMTRDVIPADLDADGTPDGVKVTLTLTWNPPQ